MLVRTKKVVVLSVMTLVAAVISLPVVTYAATSPTVAILSPLSQGLRAPVKMALDAAGNVYVADQRVGGIVRFDVYGAPLQAIKTAAAPGGLAFAQDGTLLVAQSTYVARYDVTTGVETGRLSGGQLQYASGIAVSGTTGFIYVTDSGAGQVEMYTAAGVFVKAFAKGLLSTPTGITYEKVSGQFAVADTYGNKIQFFDAEGNFVRSIGNAMSTVVGTSAVPMQFAAPVAVSFEYNKGALARMYVVDAFQGNVQVVDPVGSGSALIVSGTTKNYIGSTGTANGQLMVPSDAVFDSANSRLLVVNGYGNVTAYGIDGGKNPVYVDVTAPVFAVNPLPAEVTVNTVTVSGTVEAGATVQITGSVPVGAVVYSGSSWSAPVAALAVGVNSFSVTAADTAGNIAVPQTVSVSYLLPAPAIAINPLASTVKTSTITISGTVEDGSSVVVFNKMTSLSGNASVVGTAWSYDVALAEGANSIVVSAQKPQSAVSQAAASVLLDTVAPLLAVSALPNGSYTSTAVQNISGTVTESNGASVVVNGVPAALVGNTFSVPVTLLNGANQISVVAFDSAGNSTANSRTIIFDASKPVIAIQAPVDNSVTSQAVLRLSGSVDKVAAVTVAGIPATVDANGWSASVELAVGVNTIEIIATDLAGNSSSVKRTVTLDTVKPSLAVVTPVQDIAVNVPNAVFSGTVSDSSTLSLEYSVNGSTVAVPVIDGAYTFNVDFAAEGNYAVTVTAKDAAGNSSTVVRTVIYDITPPAFSLNQVTGAMPVRLSGTVENGSSVAVKDGAQTIGSVQIANGTWTADLAGVTYNPDALLAVATDAAGNSTSKSLVYSFPDGALVAGKPTVQDALRAIRIVVNQLTPTAEELAHYDIGPLVGGKPNPNGKIEIVDAILILRKALGLKSW